jgi:hypothetical protein
MTKKTILEKLIKDSKLKNYQFENYYTLEEDYSYEIEYISDNFKVTTLGNTVCIESFPCTEDWLEELRLLIEYKNFIAVLF